MPKLNVDMGEGCAWDTELIAATDWANIGCGVHAGSESLTHGTIERCQARNVRIGCHPGYPDREHFGRRSLSELEINDARESLISQVSAFWLMVPQAYLKPHGAFYHDSQAPGPAFDILCEILEEFQMSLLGYPGTAHEVAARKTGVPFLREGFAERGLDSSGHLLDRKMPGALLATQQEITDQVRLLAPRVDSLCVHGDSPGCVQKLAWARGAL